MGASAGTSSFVLWNTWQDSSVFWRMLHACTVMPPSRHVASSNHCSLCVRQPCYLLFVVCTVSRRSAAKKKKRQQFLDRLLSPLNILIFLVLYIVSLGYMILKVMRYIWCIREEHRLSLRVCTVEHTRWISQFHSNPGPVAHTCSARWLINTALNTVVNHVVSQLQSLLSLIKMSYI